MKSCYFQAVSGVFLRSSGAQNYGEDLRRVAAAGGRRCAFACVLRCAAVKLLFRTGAARAEPQIPAPCPMFNCPDRPSGHIGGPCAPGPAPVVHRYPLKYISYRYLLTESKHLNIYRTSTGFGYPSKKTRISEYISTNHRYPQIDIYNESNHQRYSLK